MIAEVLNGRTLGDADSSFAITEWTAEGAPPGPPQYQAPLHLHRDAPKTFALVEEIHATEDRSPERMKAIFEKYDSELVD